MKKICGSRPKYHFIAKTKDGWETICGRFTADKTPDLYSLLVERELICDKCLDNYEKNKEFIL